MSDVTVTSRNYNVTVKSDGDYAVQTVDSTQYNVSMPNAIAVSANVYKTVTGDSGTTSASGADDSLAIVGDTGITTTASTDRVSIDLDDTAVTPGSYTAADITVDQQGRLTAASSGDVDAFKTWACDTGGSVIADNAEDSVTMSGGTGITTGANNTTKTITLAVTASQISHEGLANLYGSTDDLHYHLDYAEHDALTAGGDCSIHYHSGAIHASTASEISAISEKGSPVGNDMLLIEDSADSNNKKMVKITNLPGGADSDAIHDNVAGEIHAITEETSPASTDEILIEDASDSYNKKRVQITNLPAGTPADDSITNAKLANMVQGLIKGRAAAAGTGDPTDLTATQVRDILGQSLDARSAAVAPGVDNDTDEGYYPGSLWINQVGDKAYINLDHTDGAAIWRRIDADQELDTDDSPTFAGLTVNGTDLSGVEAAADVTDATNVNDAGAVMEADYATGQSILIAVSAETPTELVVPEQALVGRVTSGNVTALTAADVRTLISVEENADVTDATNVVAALSGATLSGTLDTNGHEVTNLVDRAASTAITTSGAQTIYPGAAASGGTPYRHYRLTFGGDHTITLSTDGAAEGDACVVRLNPVTYTPAWSGVNWGDAGEPSWTASEWNYVSFFYNSGSGDWDGMAGGLGYATS